MVSFIEKYINSKKLSWSASTLKQERYRLMGLKEALDGIPENLWREMEIKGLKPYSRKTAWIRVSKFWEWGIEAGVFQGPNLYRDWQKTHQNLFKHVYEKRLPTLSMEEAKNRINMIPDEKVRKQAMVLLDHGLRVSEYNTLKPGRGVVGKGSKPRKTFGTSAPEGLLSYINFYRALKKVGLNPHDLRKIRATDLRNAGVTEADLCYIFGWTSFTTASSYLSPKKDLTLEAIFKQSFQGK